MPSTDWTKRTPPTGRTPRGCPGLTLPPSLVYSHPLWFGPAPLPSSAAPGPWLPTSGRTVSEQGPEATCMARIHPIPWAPAVSTLTPTALEKDWTSRQRPCGTDPLLTGPGQRAAEEKETHAPCLLSVPEAISRGQILENPKKTCYRWAELQANLRPREPTPTTVGSSQYPSTPGSQDPSWSRTPPFIRHALGARGCRQAGRAGSGNGVAAGPQGGGLFPLTGPPTRHPGLPMSLSWAQQGCWEEVPEGQETVSDCLHF